MTLILSGQIIKLFLNRRLYIMLPGVWEKKKTDREYGYWVFQTLTWRRSTRRWYLLSWLWSWRSRRCWRGWRRVAPRRWRPPTSWKERLQEDGNMNELFKHYLYLSQLVPIGLTVYVILMYFVTLSAESLCSVDRVVSESRDTDRGTCDTQPSPTEP